LKKLKLLKRVEEEEEEEEEEGEGEGNLKKYVIHLA
jgi:hypothetical protein